MKTEGNDECEFPIVSSRPTGTFDDEAPGYQEPKSGDCSQTTSSQFASRSLPCKSRPKKQLT
jgi:hypothetical protein